MPVPEAAVHKDNGCSRREDEIGTPGQLTPTEHVAKSPRMQTPSHQKFGFRITTSNALHHAATGRRIDNIGHIKSWATRAGWGFAPVAISGCIARAISVTSGTTTEFPNCL